MALSEMTEMQKLMYAACGRKAKVQVVGLSSPYIGECINYTQPIDNEPETASIYIRIPGSTSLYEITENEIETLEIDYGTVFCPVINGQTDGTTCLEIVLVAENSAKPTVLPDNIEWNEEQCRKCLACKYHADIKK